LVLNTCQQFSFGSFRLFKTEDCVYSQVLYADAFNLHCFQTLTGTKFLMVVKPDTPDVDEVLRTL